MATAHALPAELTIYTVSETRPHWLGWLAEADHNAHNADSDTCAVDAHAVDQIDSAGAQMLLALDAALQRKGRSLLLQAPSAALLQAFAALGLAAWAARHITTGV